MRLVLLPGMDGTGILFKPFMDAPMETVLLFHRALKAVSPRVLADRLHSILEVDCRAELDRIQVPLLWLTAKQDRLVRGACIEELPGAGRNVRLETIDAAHLILQSRPLQSAAIIRQFLDQIPG